MQEYCKEHIKCLEEAIARYENFHMNMEQIDMEKKQALNLKDALVKKYGKKFVEIQTFPMENISSEEIQAIKAELLDKSFVTILKRFLGIGKKQSQVYAELMGKLKSLVEYLEKEEELVAPMLTQEFEKIKNLSLQLRNAYQCVLTHTGFESPEKTGGKIDEEIKKLVEKSIYFGDLNLFIEQEKTNSDSVLKEFLGSLYDKEFVDVPYTRKFTEPFNIYIEYIESKKKKAYGLILSVLYQIITQMEEYELEIYLMDGEETGKNFSELLQLNNVRENNVIELNRMVTGGHYKLSSGYLSNSDISNGLKEMDAYLGKVAQETAGYKNVEEYNKSQTAKEKGMIPLRFLVIENFPIGFNDNDIELLNKIIKNGRQRGVSVILGYNRSQRMIFDAKINFATHNIMDAVILEDKVEHLRTKECSADVNIKIMEEGRIEFVKNFVREKTSIKVVDNKFTTVIGMNNPIGTMDATDGIKIPFALDKRGNLKEFQLAKSTSAHGILVGSTGSGKSYLLHYIISTICMNYTPDDIEMWLADYKLTEFNSYKHNTPPHISFLGLSNSMDFTYAFIDKILKEYEKRQRIIKDADEKLKLSGGKGQITSITEYRKYHGNKSMKRLIVIIDEFHVMSQHVVEDYEYKMKLENLLAEGRAMGITLFFSDQSITQGLVGLTDKGRKQIKCRIALANDETELKAILGISDKEELRPFQNMDSGDCAVISYEMMRTEYGDLEEQRKLEKVKCVFLSGEERYEIIEKIRNFYHAQDYVPFYIDQSEIKEYDDKIIDSWSSKNLWNMNEDRMIPVYLGEALDLSGCYVIELYRRRAENIMCVGGIEEEQIRIVFAQIRSFQRLQEHRIVILADENCRLFDMYRDELEKLTYLDPYVEVYCQLGDICDQIDKMVTDNRIRHPQRKTLLLWLGLEDLYVEFQRLKEKMKKEEGHSIEETADLLEKQYDLLFGVKDTSDKESFNHFEMDTKSETVREYNAIDDIAELINDGPRQGIFNSVFYDGVYPLRNHRKIQIENFKHKIAFSMGRDDCGEYLGRNMLLDGMEQQKGVAAYYDGRKKVKKFVPYQFYLKNMNIL